MITKQAINTFLDTYKKDDNSHLLIVNKVSSLLQDMETWEYIAEGLTQDHQQRVRQEILQKIDNLYNQINDYINGADSYIEQLALLWWNILPMYNVDKPSKRVLAAKYFQTEASLLNHKQIIAIWQSEN
jgi:hypothetical protein